MNDAKMRAECDRILIAMIKAVEGLEEKPLGAILLSGQLYVARKAVADPEAATFRKIHIIGEMNTVLLAHGYNVNAEDWYEHVPYSRDTELAFYEAS